ncbi:MAG: tyrosine--tRNA ligase, partial [archaeon]
LNYQRNRLDRADKILAGRDKELGPDAVADLIRRYDAKDKFYTLVRNNLERRNSLVQHVRGGSQLPRELAVLYSQLQPQNDNGAFETRIADLGKLLGDYLADTDAFDARALETLGKLGNDPYDPVDFMLRLSFGELSSAAFAKVAAGQIMQMHDDNLLWERSERGLEYFFKLFHGQEHEAVVKFGIDPTSPNIHLGHTVPIRILAALQDLGYYVTIINADRTARIGDPTGKSKERPKLSPERILQNVYTYVDQLGPLLGPNKTNFVYNGTYLDRLTPDDLDALQQLFTMDELMARRDFRTRSREGNSPTFLEGSYSIWQAADSIILGSTWEQGGEDQKGNLGNDRKAQERMGLDPQICVTVPDLPGTDGRKMSKSTGNSIPISGNPVGMYRSLMGLSDSQVYEYFQLLSEPADCFPEGVIENGADLFRAYGGLHLLSESTAGLVRSNRMKFTADNREVLAILQDRDAVGGRIESIETLGIDPGRLADDMIAFARSYMDFAEKEDKKLPAQARQILSRLESAAAKLAPSEYDNAGIGARELELLADFLEISERELSRVGRHLGDRPCAEYIPRYRIVADHEDKERPIRLIGLDSITSEAIDILSSNRKIDDPGNPLDARRLRETLALYLVQKHYRDAGLEAVAEYKESLMQRQGQEAGHGGHCIYVDLEDMAKGGRVSGFSVVSGILGYKNMETARRHAENGQILVIENPNEFDPAELDAGHRDPVKYRPLEFREHQKDPYKKPKCQPVLEIAAGSELIIVVGAGQRDQRIYRLGWGPEG